MQAHNDPSTARQAQLPRTGASLGERYLPTRAAALSPKFSQSEMEASVQRGFGEMHVALICIRSPNLMKDDVLDGISLTLAQLVRLDMQIVLVLDCSSEMDTLPNRSYREVYQRQGDRVAASIERHNNAGARYVDVALSTQEITDNHGSVAQVQGHVAVEIPKLILDPLKRGTIPIIPAIAYTQDIQATHVLVSDVMLALTRSLSGIAAEQPPQEPSADPADVSMSLDRIIILDSLGGLPTENREDKAHVFVNLEQEYDEILLELKSMPGAHNHSENLQLLRDCLTLLPPASSALLISPEEAANLSHSSSKDVDSIGITTRRQKNPLIHNLLTNKPIISSSLPVARLPTIEIPSESETAMPTRSTLVKRGMPLTIVPFPTLHPWTPPKPGEQTISLENHPDINLPRLVGLIEDSFRRPLDVRHYLERVRNRIAGVIIAGEYEGGAILTWEMPQSASSQSPDHYDHTRLVPYLDKFAVLQRSQGSSGVADVVFQAMVRSCFPSGVCWRSRKTNPVNKWYFERSKGTWQLRDTQWTMFWTGEGVVEDEARWKDYIEVCKNIEPSWDDNKAPD